MSCGAGSSSQGAKVRYTGIPFGCFRWHPAQKTQESRTQTESTLDVAAALIALAHSLSAETKQEILADLQAYRHEYPGLAWRFTGRLARLGLPRSIVTPIRNLKEIVATAISGLMRAAR